MWQLWITPVVLLCIIVASAAAWYWIANSMSSKPDYRLWYEKPPAVWMLDVLYVLVRLWIGFSKVTGAFREHSSSHFVAMASRSGHWPAVRRAWLADHPECAACGGKDNLQVHHKKPFHLHPTLELNTDNLLTLCEEPSRNCHFVFGHFYDWSNFNPTVERDVKEWRHKLEVNRLA